MKRFEALKIILTSLKNNDLVITTTGMISREAFGAKDRKGNFYMIGSMGLVTPVALGIALNSPEKKIIGIEGDGSMLLNLGSMAMVGAEKPDNLITIIIDNGCYESTGGQYCISQEVDLAKLAESSGYLNITTVEYEESLKEMLSIFLNKSGPSFILVKVDSSREESIPRVSLMPEEIKERFVKAIVMIKKILPMVEKAYQMPTVAYFGRGTIEEIADLPETAGFKKILLVCGEHFKKGVYFANLQSDLSKRSRIVLVYEGKIAKSDFETVNTLTDYCRTGTPDLVVAVGGGTILDTAKCAAILAVNGGKVEDYFFSKTRQLQTKGIPLLAIPTTAGTGSEVTPWAVVWDFANHEKYSLSSPLMFPSLAIVDPSLTDGLPVEITAETGMDALTQAIEAYWSKFHNPVSDKYALEAVSLAMKYLPKAVNFPDNESRDMMAKASFFAGLAFSNTKTTICHSVSYPMTIHWGVAHGQAVSITLPEFIRYSLPALEGRETNLLDSIGTKTPEEAARKIEEFMKEIGLATRLSELGIKKEDILIIVSEGYNPDRANNAPRVPTPEELKLILEKIL